MPQFPDLGLTTYLFPRYLSRRQFSYDDDTLPIYSIVPGEAFPAHIFRRSACVNHMFGICGQQLCSLSVSQTHILQSMTIGKQDTHTRTLIHRGWMLKYGTFVMLPCDPSIQSSHPRLPSLGHRHRFIFDVVVLLHLGSNREWRRWIIQRGTSALQLHEWSRVCRSFWWRCSDEAALNGLPLLP